VRYRIHAAAFVLSAAVGPLALAASALRAAPSAAAGAGVPAALTGLVFPALVVAAAGGVALLIELAFEVVKLRRVKRRASPLGTLAVRRARIGTSPTVSTPTAIGYVHPAVVLPEGFRARVDAREWDAVVAHECAHLARRDDWAKAVQSALSRAAWWVPGLWILGRALDLERELASDERAACESGARHYAACLLRLATDRPGSALAPAFGGRRSHVAIRVERLLRPVAPGAPFHRAMALGAFTAAAFAVLAGALVALPGTAVRVASAPAPVVLELAGHPARRPAPRLAAHRPAAAHRRAAPLTTLAAAAVPPAPPAERPRFVAVTRPAVLAVRPRSEFAVRPRRTEPHRTARRPAADVVGTLAYVAPHLRCRTCFGPLRSPDDAVPPKPEVFTPPAALASNAPVAVAADDPNAGPVSLSPRTVWFRIPLRVLSGQ